MSLKIAGEILVAITNKIGNIYKGRKSNTIKYISLNEVSKRDITCMYLNSDHFQTICKNKVNKTNVTRRINMLTSNIFHYFAKSKGKTRNNETFI